MHVQVGTMLKYDSEEVNLTSYPGLFVTGMAKIQNGGNKCIIEDELTGLKSILKYNLFKPG